MPRRRRGTPPDGARNGEWVRKIRSRDSRGRALSSSIISDGGARGDSAGPRKNVPTEACPGSGSREVRWASSGGSVEPCRPEQRVGQRSFQIVQSEPHRVERAAHPLPRIYTDRGTEPVGEFPRDRRGLVDVSVEG